MVNFAPHIRMTALGHFGNSGETFSWGLSLVEQGWTFNDFFDATQYWTDVADSVKDFHSSPVYNVGQAVVLDDVKFAKIKANGTYGTAGVDYTESFMVHYGAAGGAGSAGSHPPQDALCVSLDTSLHGPSGRGRVYLPMPEYPIDTTQGFRLPLSYAQNIAGRFQTMCNDINNAPGPDSTGSVRIVIASSKGFNTDVQSIRIGRVIDTMRSRRKSMDEGYTADYSVG